jgi:hypothetical protein
MDKAKGRVKEAAGEAAGRRRKTPQGRLPTKPARRWRTEEVGKPRMLRKPPNRKLRSSWAWIFLR